MNSIRNLKGMYDRSFEDRTSLNRALEKLGRYMASAGYENVDVPLLEETELFLRKSGGELASKLYSFTDPGGQRVSLRPEFTASVVRSYTQGTLGNALPIRVQYSGPVFRYESNELFTYRQFTQFGAELLGSATVAADAEVVAMATRGLLELGAKRLRVTVGHVGLVNALLEELQLAERSRMFILTNLPRLRLGTQEVTRVREQAADLGLLGTNEPKGALSDLVRGLSDEDARVLVDEFVNEAVGEPMGQRTAQEISQRYLRKLRGSDDPKKMTKALTLARDIARCGGPPKVAIRKIKALIDRHGFSSSVVTPLEGLLELLASYKLRDAEVVVDLSLARGIGYYTGMVFELDHPAITERPFLGGGGRYDGLIKAIGGDEDTPALGFAYVAERVVQILGVNQQIAKGDEMPVLVAPFSADANDRAVDLVLQLREKGSPAELEIMGRSPKSVCAYAAGRGIKKVITVYRNGKTTEDIIGSKRRGSPSRST